MSETDRPGAPTPSSAVGDLLRPFVRDRTFVLVGAPLRPLAAEAMALLDLGARHAFVVGDGVGSATPPEREGFSWQALDVAAATLAAGRARATAALADLPADVHRALDALDPDRTAWVINANNSFTEPTVAGRRVLGRSRAEWTALEDKTRCDELWAAAGVPHAPHEIVAADRDALVAASRRLDRGAGTVWAGDARNGVNTGAELTRWVRDPGDVEPVAALLGASCDRARVMPFLEGIPCSIHGVLTVDGVAALRPCEMLVVRDGSPGHLTFIGLSTAWDPRPDDREAMRDVARRVGALLRERYGYLGTFTVDGVLTEGGFRPTELNPRIGGALALMGASVPETGLVLHTQFLAHEIDTGLRARDVEELVVAAADAHRGAWANEMVAKVVAPVQQPIVIENGLPRLARPDEERHGAVRVAAVASYLPSAAVVDIDAGRLPVGPSSAPLMAAALDLAKAAGGLPLGRYEPARPVRP